MTTDLAGRAVLLVEDEYLHASELRRYLEKAGATVLGPVHDVASARKLLAQHNADAAVLDIELKSALVYPLADELLAAGVPIIFATGYDASALPKQFRDVPRYIKPVSIQQLLGAISRLAPRASEAS